MSGDKDQQPTKKELWGDAPQSSSTWGANPPSWGAPPATANGWGAPPAAAKKDDASKIYFLVETLLR